MWHDPDYDGMKVIDALEHSWMVQDRSGKYAIVLAYRPNKDGDDWAWCISGPDLWAPIDAFDKDGKMVTLLGKPYRSPDSDIVKVWGDADSPRFAARADEESAEHRKLIWERGEDGSEKDAATNSLDAVLIMLRKALEDSLGELIEEDE